jgi:asparagine synthase (glutamine-hydrolysing)
VKTFTVGFGGAALGYDEVEHARKVARAFGTEHHETILEENVVDILPKVLWHFDEPFGNSTVILAYLLSRFTREHVTVALSGTGGDEVFFGYPRYVGLQYADAYRRLPRFLRKGVLERAVRALPESSAGNDPVRRLAKRTKRFVNGSDLDPDARYVSWLTYFDREEQSRLVRDRDAWARHEKGIDRFLFDALRGGNGDGLGYPDRAFRADLLTFLPFNQLEYMDKMSMAQSLEARVPFCDHLLVEWSASLRPDLKLSPRGTKVILKKAMKGILPDSIVNRRKVGFDAPVGHWFKRELKDLLVDTLSPARLAETGLLEPKAVEALLAQHLSGRRDLSVHLWILLVLEVWYRLYILEGIAEEPGYGLRELLAA